jgi:hypothetical protein
MSQGTGNPNIPSGWLNGTSPRGSLPFFADDINFTGALNRLRPHVANGPINAQKSASHSLSIGTAYTIAAPGDDDFFVEIVTLDTAAPVLTFTGGTLRSGTAAVATAHFAAFAGSSLVIVSQNGFWHVLGANQVTFA